MSRLTVADLAVDLGGQRVLRDVSITVDEGALAVIVGPSGCGKSTLLRAVAGLARPVAGLIHLDGATLSDASTFVAPERRRVGWVPQSASLFPHLTVVQNIAFGLGPTGRSARAAVPAELLELTGLSELAGRYPDELSGGQAQRVSLARALAAQPDLLLLDEPFAALDPQLRAELRDELAAMLRRLGVTAVLVTHDQGEALLMADSVIVMRDGTVAQQGSAVEVYRAPASAWVAAFLGEANFLAGVAERGRATTILGEVTVPADASGAVSLMLRPEQLRLGADGVPARVSRIRYGGHDAIVEARTAEGQTLLVRVPAGDIPARDGDVMIRIEGPGVVFPDES
ncbi:ABC transporter ATP-binding protein [Microbacterium lacus]|uniref:ABC transporter ATP-binding protein n=1 Tax=Microbacterium lacus TaxID=415217 RepID=UPI000C2C46B4|nr:ABC transporter ATP-binding protein [Microbacterium lacus]